MSESNYFSGVLYLLTFNQGESWLQSTVSGTEKCVTCVPCIRNPRLGFSASWSRYRQMSHLQDLFPVDGISRYQDQIRSQRLTGEE